MIERFYPDLIVDRVQNIDLGVLKEKGIKGLILDIDNTLVPQYTEEAGENVVKWIERVKKEGLNACIVSNASRTRVVKFNERLKILAIHRATKPSAKAFIRAVSLMGINLNEAAVVGDQIFTDVYGGNRLNMLTVLVSPIDKREVLIVRLKRYAEKVVLAQHVKSYKNSSSIDKRLRWKKKNAVKYSKGGLKNGNR